MSTDRLARGREGRMVAGVCTGLGRRTDVDPIVFRIGFVTLVMASGLGLFLYLAAVLLMGDDEGAPSIVERVSRRRLSSEAVLALLAALMGGGVLVGIAGQGLITGVNGDTLTTVTVFGLVLLVAHNRGVDLPDLAKNLPTLLQGKPLERSRENPLYTAPGSGSVRFDKGSGLQPGWIDLATLNAPHSRTIPRPQDAEPSRLDEPAPHAAAPTIDRHLITEEVAACAPRRRSVLTPVTLLVAIMAASAMVPVAAGYPGERALQIVLASGLSVVGLGLVAGTWFGRPRGLVFTGICLSLALTGSAVASDVPAGTRYGDVTWHPTDPGTAQTYRMGIGDGLLDLTGLVLAPGQKVAVTAEVGVGTFKVTVPRGVRLEVNASAGLGDITIDKKIVSGPRARLVETFEGEGANPPVIVLMVKGKIGDMEVARV